MSTPEQLFARFRATGEAAPLGELFDVASGELLALALHLCGNPADAEDALQATFLTAIAQRGQWDSARRVLPWLCGILTMHAKKIAERRARRRETALPEPDLVLDDGSPVAASERRELIGRLRQHVDRLPAEQRQVLLLQLEHGLAPAEVAEVLGVPPGTVRMRLHRGVAALRGLMPAGLFALLLGTLPTRGVAAVRAVVLQHAAGAAAGALLLKKVLAAIAVLVVLAVGWYAAPPMSRTSERSAGTSPVLVTSGPVENSHERARDGAAAGMGERVDVTAPVVAPAAATGTLLVRTVDKRSRAPLPHVPVQVCSTRSDADSQFDAVAAATDRDGRCVITGLPPGPYRAGLPASTDTRAVVAAGAVTAVDVELESATAAMVRGRALLADGAPAAGATLVAAVQYTRGAGPVGTADAAGRFELPIVRGFVMLGARLDGHAPSALELVPGRPDVELELVLPSLGAVVRGLAVDDMGAPVAGAVVEIGDPRRRPRWSAGNRAFASPPAQLVRTGTDGTFHAADLPAEPISVFVRADGFAPFHCYVTPCAGETSDVRCDLERGAAVRGRVLDQHRQPVADVRVRLGGTSGEQRVTDADGRFGFRHAVAGVQQLELASDAIDKTFRERTANDAGEWLVAVERLAVFPLRFVDESGQPLAKWAVRLSSTCEREDVTDDGGRVALHAGGAGAPRLWLGPDADLDAAMPWPWPAFAVPGIEATIVVPVDRHPRAVLTGVVHGAGGEPLGRGQVSLRSLDGKLVAGAALVAGTFRLERVPAGDWQLVVGGELGLRVAVHALRQGEVRDVGVSTLPPAGAVLARVVLSDGTAAPDPGLFLFDADGREEAVTAGEPHELPAGRYTWRVIANDALWQRGDIVVRAGETTPLDVTLRPGVRRYVRFPVPRPDWGEPALVKYVLRAADGGEYDRGDFDPRDDMPHRYMPALAVGQWRVELELDDGRRFHGAFTLDTLTPSRAPIDVTVQPTR